jgi:hypothetical protein
VTATRIGSPAAENRATAALSPVFSMPAVACAKRLTRNPGVPRVNRMSTITATNARGASADRRRVDGLARRHEEDRQEQPEREALDLRSEQLVAVREGEAQDETGKNARGTMSSLNAEATAGPWV